MAEINAHRVICPKSARGVLGSRDYTHHQKAATKALPHVFASAKHFHAKNAEGESSNKYANLQSKYACNLAKIKNLNIIWMHGICQIPLSFLRSSTLMLYQGKIARQIGSQQKCTYWRIGGSLPSDNAAHGSKILSIMPP